MSKELKAHLMVAGVALTAYAVVTFIQRNVFAVPVVGQYLPK